MAYLILVRHGLSEYNKKGIWTGWDNPQISPEGKEDAKAAGKSIQNIPLTIGFTSPQIRHKETLEIIKNTLNLKNLPIIESDALKERNYGIYTGKNKWDIKKELGDEEFLKLRRGWDYPIKGGESLKQVYERSTPYYEENIKPHLLKEENVIVSSSGNVLRSLVKYLENISDSDITSIEIAPGEVYVYTLDDKGNITNKEIRNKHANTV